MSTTAATDFLKEGMEEQGEKEERGGSCASVRNSEAGRGAGNSSPARERIAAGAAGLRPGKVGKVRAGPRERGHAPLPPHSVPRKGARFWLWG